MVIIDIDVCAGCGRCVVYCPAEALTAWGYLEIDKEKCTDCLGENHHLARKSMVNERGSIQDRARATWPRNCVINCPVGALRVSEEESDE